MQKYLFFYHKPLSYLLTLLKYSLARFGSGRIVGLFGFQFIGQTKIDKIVILIVTIVLVYNYIHILPSPFLSTNWKA